MLIGQRKVRYLLADLWTGAVAVVLGFYELAPGTRGYILSASGEFADYLMKDCGLGVSDPWVTFLCRGVVNKPGDLSRAGAVLVGR